MIDVLSFAAQWFRRIVFLIALVLPAATVQAQYDRVWTFGTKGGLSFAAGNPQQAQNMADMRGNSASICDHNGNLLFYTDGNYVWNRQHNLMVGGVNLTVGPGLPVKLPDPGNGWIADATAIAMKPGDPGKYYIFSERREPIDPNIGSTPYYPSDLYYSIVDMSENNGLGAVIEKGTFVDSNVQKLTLVAGNDCNIWLVTHQGLGNAYKSYNITADGVSAPVVSTTGGTITDVELAGTLTVSHNRTRLVLTNIGVSAQLSDFDPVTGIVSNTVTLPVGTIGPTPPSYPAGPVDMWQGAAFSPDDSKLYLCGLSGYLAQIDLTLSPLMGLLLGQTYNGTAVTGLVRSSVTLQSGLKTGPDGKIYFHYEKTLDNGTIYPTVTGNDNQLGVIQQPNIAGAGCNVSLTPVLNMSPAPYINSLSYFPNEIGILRVADTVARKYTLCLKDSVRLAATDTAGYSYAWQQGGDKASVWATHPGTYVVRYYTYGPCVYHIDSFVVARAGFDFSLGPDTTLCHTPPYTLGAVVPGASYRWQDGVSTSNYTARKDGLYILEVTRNGCTLTDSVQLRFLALDQDLGADIQLCYDMPVAVSLNAKVTPGAAILWSTGSTQPGIRVTDTGTYWVRVSESVCTASDTMRVSFDPLCYCHFEMPNAFSPNGDGLNDMFRPVVSAECPVQSYKLSIYNRWGQRVFYSAKAEQGWDGTIEGQTAEVGTYMYEVQFLGGTQKRQHTRKGDLVLVR